MTESKKKRGRPQKADSKGVMISARFTESEAKAIAEAHTKAGLSKTEWIRKVLTSEAVKVNCNT